MEFNQTDMNELEKRLEEVLRVRQGRPPDDAELADLLSPADRGLFAEQLESLRRQGRVARTRRGGWALPGQIGMAAGRLQRHVKGFAFLIPNDPEAGDIFIPASQMNGAMHGDRVLVTLSSCVRNGERKQEGAVREVLERARDRLVGVFESTENGGYVIPDNTRIGMDLFIPQRHQGAARNGMKVVAEITRWPEGQRGPAGRVVEVLGPADDVGVDILSIIREMGLPDRFPDSVLRESAQIAQTVPPQWLEGRLDLRDRTVFTIDGADAKDLDDAVSVEELPGGWRLGVHIADVSQYVRPGTALDGEALLRGTSVYLVDRVVPMLPEALSNGICSLHAGPDRLTLSCVMDIDGRGTVTGYDIAKSVIRSSARMTYDDVNRVLAGDAGACRRYAALAPHFAAMARLAEALRDRRIGRGSLELDIDEARIELDAEGKPVHISPRERGQAHRMIEEFMLSANETVAGWLSGMEMPAIYRVHESPDPDRMRELALFAQNLGYRLGARPEETRPRDLQALLRAAQDTPEENILGRIVLRSMQKARYSPVNKGHFGLAAETYCHFTSPIRRYPDLFVHRVIHAALEDTVSDSWLRLQAGKAAEAARLSSERELAAQEAERAADDLKMTEYMSGHIGEVFDGILSGVTEFGLFVELPSTIEGLVRMASLDDDYYVYDEKRYCLTGQRTRRVYRLGDPVRVVCVQADVARRQIGFEMAD